MPSHVKELIEEAFLHKRIPKEYLLSSIFYAYGNAAGLAFKVNWQGYTNYSNLYFAIIGSRGDTKSEAMKMACNPLKLNDDQDYETYNQRVAELKSKEPFEQENEKIRRKQLLIQNATIEAAMYVHYQNPYSIGMFFDELSYIIEMMANKNSGAGAVWRIFFLQGNTNSYVDVNRKTTDSYRLKKSCPLILGSIQHQFIPKMFANGNLESGLMDRFLFTNKLTDNPKISRAQIPDGIIANYEDSLTNLLKYRSDIEETKKEVFINFEKDAYNLIHSYSQSILDKKQKETGPENEYMSKMMISIHKIALLIHLIIKSTTDGYQEKINTGTVHLAILINEYYLTNFKIVLESKNKSFDDKLFNEEIIKRGVKNNVPQTELIKLTGLSKGQVSKLYNRNNTEETGN